MVAVTVNYLVSISFVPAALSLYAELSHVDGRIRDEQRKEEDMSGSGHVSNPVVQQVKIIMVSLSCS